MSKYVPLEHICADHFADFYPCTQEQEQDPVGYLVPQHAVTIHLTDELWDNDYFLGDAVDFHDVEFDDGVTIEAYPIYEVPNAA